MKYEIEFRPLAEVDLFNIYRYIARRSGIDAAGSYVERIGDACQALELSPKRGTRRDDLGRGIRIIGFERRIAIAFRVTGRKVEIMRVLYGGRDLGQALKE
ncbi:type II toxin-antitoxin system RelE/ParE family toxin [Desertibaculum subflavum]|uniref:type II toxin-antitoxin system RelE/ParE family toxin n=1 Tax=Desertibaculum subflavum TaxID=2268458 RepID=UPI000E66FE46